MGNSTHVPADREASRIVVPISEDPLHRIAREARIASEQLRLEAEKTEAQRRALLGQAPLAPAASVSVRDPAENQTERLDAAAATMTLAERYPEAAARIRVRPAELRNQSGSGRRTDPPL
jgi:hypothetical protein